MKGIGVGPHGIGSNLTQKDKPIKGGMLKETTVTAKKPKNTIRPLKKGETSPVMGNPPMVGAAKMLGMGKSVTKGINLMKSTGGTSKIGKAIEVVGEIFDTSTYFKK